MIISTGVKARSRFMEITERKSRVLTIHSFLTLIIRQIQQPEIDASIAYVLAPVKM